MSRKCILDCFELLMLAFVLFAVGLTGCARAHHTEHSHAWPYLQDRRADFQVATKEPVELKKPVILEAKAVTVSPLSVGRNIGETAIAKQPSRKNSINPLK